MDFWSCSFYVLFVLFLFKCFLKFTNGICKSNVSLVGKTAIVTGASSGIGYQTALGLAARGCRVIVASRSSDENIRKQIVKYSNNPNIVARRLDLGSLASVRRFAKEILATENRLDILINNTGAGGLGNKFTDDGLQIGMAVNHFGSFLLTHLLTDLLKKSAPSRIIFVSSLAAFTKTLTLDNLNNPYEDECLPSNITGDKNMYCNSKVCTVITSNGFSERLKGSGVTSNAIHPGFVDTNLHYVCLSPYWPKFAVQALGYVLLLFMKSPWEGAQTTLRLAVSNKLRKSTGLFYADCIPIRMPQLAKNRILAEGVWKKSEELVKLRPDEKLQI